MDILRGGWAPGLLGNGAGLRADSPSTGGGYATESMAIFAAFSTPPTTGRKEAIDGVVVALKSAGVWDKLDALYAFAAADSQAAKVNWRQPGTYNATEVGAPTFTADAGFTGNGTTSYLDSTFNPSTATTPKFVQNDASIFSWSRTDIDVVGGIHGYVTSTATLLQPRNANTVKSQVNGSATADSFANTNGIGFYAAVRTGSTATTVYKDGVSVGSGANGSSAPANETIVMLRRTTGYWPGQIAFNGFGSQLSGAEVLALYNALTTYSATISIAYQAETEAIAAAFTTSPTTARKGLIDAAVVSLKSAGVWAKLDALYLFAGADAQAAKINWKAPGTFNATEVGAPTFTADIGFTGASTKYIDSNFNPTTASTPQFVQNSATIFTHLVTNVQTAAAVMGYLAAAPAIYLQTRHTNDTSSGHMNQVSADIVAASTDSSGFWTLTRTASSLTTNYRNGSSVGSHAQASIAPSNASITILANNATYWAGQSAAAGIGSGLAGADVTALYNAIRTYLTGVGVP